jgi:hypothetical protein
MIECHISLRSIFEENICFVVYNLLIDISFRAPWAAPLAIYCGLFVLLLISGTIVLALIPIYLAPKDINAINTTSIS